MKKRDFIVFLVLILFLISSCKEEFKGKKIIDNKNKLLTKNLNKFDYSEVNVQELKQKTSKMKERTFEGSLTVIHQDDFFNEKSKNYYFLQTKNKNYRLISEDDLDKLEPGSEIQIKGKLSKDKIFISKIDENSLKTLKRIIPSQIPDTIGPQRTAVILVNFQDNPSEMFTKEQVKQIISKVNDFYKENSYGKTWLTGGGNAETPYPDIYGWYTLPHNQICDLGEYEIIATVDNDLYFPNYNRIIVIYPSDPVGCRFAGATHGLGSNYYYTADGRVMFSIARIIANDTIKDQIGTYNEELPYIISHELGHNFGSDHANLFNCGDYSTELPRLKNCDLIEYGDRWSVLGGWRSFYHFNARHKEIFKWFDEEHIINVNQPGIYNIWPIEINNNKPKALKIKAGNEFYERYYYIEYRQPIGFDSNIERRNPDITKGALFHIFYNFPRNMNPHLSDTLLIDLHPPFIDYSNLGDFTLKPGETYYDNIAGISIKNLDIGSTDEKMLSLKIDFIPSLCERNDPEISIKPSSTKGEYPPHKRYKFATYSITVENKDTIYCLPINNKIKIDNLNNLLNFDNNVFEFNNSWIMYPGLNVINGLFIRSSKNNPIGVYKFYLNYSDTYGRNKSIPFKYILDCERKSCL